MSTHGARARWAVPAAVIAVVGIVIGATAAASAAVPSLPARTAAQLLAAVGRAAQRPPGPYTATITQTADLGLPQLSMPTQSGLGPSLTSGTQSVDIWYADPQHVRIAVPVQAGESDARLDGRTLWLWNSKSQAATKVTLPAYRASVGGSGESSAGATGESSPPITPAAAASELLRAIGPSTVVGVQSPVYVAHRPAYQLSLAPKSSQSLVSQVLIAIDASRGIPLRVEVYGRGGTGLAYSIGFTSLSFGTPAAVNFSFTPPPGATVTTQTVPTNPGSLLPGLGVAGGLAGPAPRTPSSASAGKPTAIGSGWLSVVATPADPAMAAAVHQLLTDRSAGTSSQRGGGFFGSSSSQAPDPSASGQQAVPVGQYLAYLQAVLMASTPVTGNWGSGRLLQTALISVLVTSKGQILVGAVSPSVLYADVAKDAG